MISEISFYADKIINSLKQYTQLLPQLYQWNANLSGLVQMGVITSVEANALDKLTSYQKEINLKQIVGRALKAFQKEDQAKFDQLAYWIIRDWVGIKTAKREDTLLRVHEFLSSSMPFSTELPYQRWEP